MHHEQLNYSLAEFQAQVLADRLAADAPFRCIRARVYVRRQDCVAAINPLCKECATGERIRRMS
jgi:hypothetical protein